MSLARYVASACRALAVLCHRVALRLELVANRYNDSDSAPELTLTACSCRPKFHAEEKATELQSFAQVRAGYVLPVERFEDELTLRNALNLALRGHLPVEAPGQA